MVFYLIFQCIKLEKINFGTTNKILNFYENDENIKVYLGRKTLLR